MFAFAGFTVARDEDRLRLRRGLLSRREATVPVARVQAVRVIEGVLRRPFGLVTVRAEVAGYAKEAAAAQTVFPLLRRAEVRPFLEAFLPELADDADGLEGVPRRALRRYVLPMTAATLLAAGAVCVAVPAAAPWPLLAALPAAALGAAQWRAAGWRIRDGRTAFRSRRLAVVTVLAPAARLQEHGVRQTVLQRPAGLADVELRVGASTAARVRHLDAAVAGRVFDALRASTGAGGGPGARLVEHQAPSRSRLPDAEPRPCGSATPRSARPVGVDRAVEHAPPAACTAPRRLGAPRARRDQDGGAGPDGQRADAGDVAPAQARDHVLERPSTEREPMLPAEQRAVEPLRRRTGRRCRVSTQHGTPAG